MPLIGKYFHFLILCLLSLIGLVLAANPVPLTNVCYFPEEYPRQAGFRAITAGLASTILQGSVDELLNYSGLSSLTTQQTTTTTPNFQLPTLPLPTNVYGLTVVPLYLLVQLQGYFVPPVSGQYTFSLENTNDAAIIFFGNPSAFPCGDLSAWPQASADDITVTDGTFPSRTLFLKAGVAYPMRISYYNSLGSGNLAVSFTDPGGTKRTNWNGYIWRYNSCSTCTYTPPPAGTTIYSSGWLLDSTTVTTSYSLYTGIDGVESTYTLYKVGVPTITPSLEVPPLTTVTLSYNEYNEENVVSYYSTTTDDGSPIIASTTLTIRTIYSEAPEPITITIEIQPGLTNYEIISYWTTTNADGQFITTSTSTTYSPPPVGTVSVYENHELVEDVYSYFITLDGSGNIITDSVLISATTIYDAAPEPSTNVIDLGEEVTGYEVISFYTTVDGDGKVVTTSTSTTYSPPPVGTVSVYENHELVEDVYSYFITLDGSGNIITDSVLISATTIYDAAPEPSTNVIDLGEEVTGYEVVTYWTMTNEAGDLITTSSTVTYSPPAITVVGTTGSNYVESDWISFFITRDVEGQLVTGSTTLNGTREYIEAEVVETSLLSVPTAETRTIDSGNGVTEYEVVTHWTTTNEAGDLITTSSTVTYSPPAITVVGTTGSNYVESDWISFFITRDVEGQLVTGSTTLNGTREYIEAEVVETSLLSVPTAETRTIDSGNGVTEYEVVTHWTTTNEAGDLITTSSTVTYSPPAITVVGTTGSNYVESDWISFFITRDVEGQLITGSSIVDYSFFSALNRTISNAGSNSLSEEASSQTSISDLKPDIATITNLRATSSITMSSYVSSAKRWSNSSKEIKISTSSSATSNKELTKASSYYLKGTIVNTIANVPGALSSKNAISNSVGVHPPIKTDEATSATSSYGNSRMDTHSWVPSSKSSPTPSSVESSNISSVINQFENNTTLETRRKTNIESKMSQSSSHDNELYGSFYGGSPHTREGNLSVALVIILVQFLL
ncbi:PWP5 [Nakaseomyces glabratus]|uniref:PA14 domain-containing protein n=1 Tax=Candida glabrata (strain ATCC 2001 / BCRC 20586 / JCM 3761 / NBRC 0622 / NRRL Y-65 / CBS 138) TaxID=284593 RepID=Q6FQ05_CANGA|nr:uncharacterized protein CAGL0I10340g [Nakaseomyces glabratus]QHS67341.1 PWP5 [Nakaseomyces glabratus]CAG60634.1 unnamed protein product [Nakaseomyces glabratus]|eukprot:XP_447689.1 uncharacterized protein CAGL0I10340g [[Candida] glabrata]